MHRDQYKKIESHPLRNVFRNMITDPDLMPSRTALREAINEAVPAGTDQKVKDALFTKATELARESQSQGRGAWFDLRGAADQLVLKTVEGFEAADRIVPVEDADVDVDAAMKAIDNWNPLDKAVAANAAAAKDAELQANLRRRS